MNAHMDLVEQGAASAAYESSSSRSRAAAFLLIPFVLCAGCFTVNTALPGALRGDLSEQEIEPVGHFQREIRHSFAPFGLGEVPDDPFRALLLEEANAQGADGIRNLRIETYHSCNDVLTGWMTCQSVRPRTFRISGELVRIRKAPLPGDAPKTQPKVPLSDPEYSPGSDAPGQPQMTLGQAENEPGFHY